MIVEPHLFEQHLPDNQERLLELLSPDGALVAKIVRREAVALNRERMVQAVANKHGYLRFLRLLVPAYVAMQIVRRYRRPPVMSSAAITRPSHNSMHWKPCFDRAKLGQMSSHSTIHFRRGASAEKPWAVAPTTDRS